MTLIHPDTIGPAIEALPLSPTRLHVEGVEPATLPSFLAPSPTFVASIPSQASNPRALIDQVASLVLSALAIRSSPAGSNMLLVALTMFCVWVGYGAIPGLSDSLPLSSWRGAAYMAILVPGSIFASCVLLALGKAFGIAAEHLAAKMARGKARGKAAG